MRRSELLSVCILSAHCLVNVSASAAAWSSPAIDPELTLRSGGRRSDERSEVYAVVELAIPLEKFDPNDHSVAETNAGGSRAQAQGHEPSTAELHADHGGPEGLTPDLAASRKSEGERGRARNGEPVDEDREAVERMASVLIDPQFARQCIAHAFRKTAPGSPIAALDELRSRARTSAILPDLKLRGGRSTDSSLRLTPTQEDPYRYTQTGGNDFFLEAQVSWHLSRLIFASEEIAVQRLRQQQQEANQKRVERILGLLADWQSAAAQFMNRSADVEQRIKAWVGMSVAGFWLDALTDGWFGTAIGPRLDALRGAFLASGSRRAEAPAGLHDIDD